MIHSPSSTNDDDNDGHESGRPATIVSFPVPDEERARRLKVEVERLARQSSTEWLYYIESPGYPERFGVDKVTFRQMIEAAVKAIEKKAREDRGEARRREDRVERRHEVAKRDEERRTDRGERERRRLEEREAREQERRDREERKEAERKAREREKALAAIVKLPSAEHDAALKTLAKRSGEDIEVLRAEFDELLGDEAEKIRRGIVEPWDSPVETRALLKDVLAQITRYVVIHDENAAVAIALWVYFAWIHDIATFSPILVIQGADSNMGKTVLCKVIALLTPRAYVIVEPTGPAMYRFVDRHRPTLVVDDADRLLPRRPDLVHIINASWTRNTPIPRADAKGNVHLFDPFCPKVLSGIDLLAHLAPATRTRCITVDLLPKSASEDVTSFRRAVDDEYFVILRRKLLRWATDNMAAIKAANPTMPDGFTNRLEENYTVMLAIADMAGRDWPKRARTAAAKLSREHDEPSMGKRLLAVFYNLFVRHGSLLTSKQAEELVPIEADEFASYRNHNRPINRFEIAALLKPYGVFPSVIHPRGRPADRGYDASSFAIAFKHYLGKALPEGRTVVRKGRGRSRK